MYQNTIFNATEKKREIAEKNREQKKWSIEKSSVRQASEKTAKNHMLALDNFVSISAENLNNKLLEKT